MIYTEKLPEEIRSSLGTIKINDKIYEIVLDYNTDYSYVVDRDRTILMYFDASCNGYNLKGKIMVRLVLLHLNGVWGFTTGDYEDAKWFNTTFVYTVELEAAKHLVEQGIL